MLIHDNNKFMTGQFLSRHVAVKQIGGKTFRPRRSSSVTIRQYCNWWRPSRSKRLTSNLFYCYVSAQDLPSHTFAVAMSLFQITINLTYGLNKGRLYFADRPHRRGPIQKDRAVCLLPPLAAAQRMEVTVGKGRGGVTLTLTLTLKDASYHWFDGPLRANAIDTPTTGLETRKKNWELGVLWCCNKGKALSFAEHLAMIGHKNALAGVDVKVRR